GRLLVNGACPEAAALGRRFKASTYGVPPGVDTRLWVTSVGPRRATGVLRVEGSNVVIDIPQPGLHNLENAAAATLVALELGVDPLKVEALLARFPGVARRAEAWRVTCPKACAVGTPGTTTPFASGCSARRRPATPCSSWARGIPTFPASRARCSSHCRSGRPRHEARCRTGSSFTRRLGFAPLPKP